MRADKYSVEFNILFLEALKDPAFIRAYRDELAEVTEAYWRSKLSAEIYDFAEKLRREATSPSMGVAVAAIVAQAGDNIGKMPPKSEDRK